MNFFTSVVATIFLLGSACLVNASGQERADTVYYYVDDAKIEFNLRYSLIPVRPNPGTSSAEAMGYLRKFSLYQHITDEQILGALATSIEPLFVPVEATDFESYDLAVRDIEAEGVFYHFGVAACTPRSDTVAIFTFLILARFKPNTSLQDQEEILRKLDLAVVDKSKHGFLTLALNGQGSLFDVFEKSNALHESPLVEYSQPDSLLSMDSPLPKQTKPKNVIDIPKILGCH